MSSMDFKSPIRDDSRVENMIRRAMAKAAYAAIAQVKIAPSWRQALWAVDPLNVSGVASDSNPGTLALPVRTYQGGVAARWGTYSPRLRQNTTLQFLSSHSDNSDPVYFKPYIENGAAVTVRGADLGTTGAPLIGSGLLAATAAKNRATPQILRATLDATAGVGNLLVNTTRNARCWVEKNTAGTTFQLTQPFAPATIPIPFAGSGAEVDTFANGDAFQRFQPTRINLVDIRPVLVDPNVSATNQLNIYQCVGFDPLGGGASPMMINQAVSLVEAQFARFIMLQTDGPWFSQQLFWNVCGGALGGVPGLLLFGGSNGVDDGVQNVSSMPVMVGGCIGFSNFSGALFLDGDVIVAGNCAGRGGQRGLVCIDSGITYNEMGDVDARTTANTFFASCIIWGAGTLDLKGATRMALVAGAGASAAEFPSAGFTLKANSGTTADSHTGAAPDVLNGGITISPANLDAAAGAAGFGGEAFVLSGAAYRKLPL